MMLHVLMVGDRIEKAENMLADPGIEAIEEDGIRGAAVTGELKFGIVDDDVAIVADPESASNLQDEPHFFFPLSGHGSLRRDDLAANAKLGYLMQDGYISVHEKEGLCESKKG